MDCLKKIKPVHWLVAAVVIIAVIYLARKNEYFTLSLNDGGSSMSLNCPPGFHPMITKNWHKAKLNEMHTIHSSHVHPNEGMAQEMQIAEKCLDPADAGDVRNALLDLAHLMQDLNPSITVKETIEQIHNNHTSYANVFDKLNTVFKSALNNQQIRKCLNMHPNSPVNKYIEEVRVTDMKELNEKLETLRKIHAILNHYENNIALFKNDLMEYLTVSVEESNLPPGHKVLHTEVMTVSQHILNKLGNILSNNSSSIYNQQELNKMNVNDREMLMKERQEKENRRTVMPLNNVGNIVSTNGGVVNMAQSRIPQNNVGNIVAQPRMPQNNVGNLVSTNGEFVNMAQPRMM